jgi:protein involved in polysaccharide export with SLBB domain
VKITVFHHLRLQTEISWLACHLAWALLFCATAGCQPESRPGAGQVYSTEQGASAPGRSRDIITDNLERVAASASQILEVLNKEVGLMVEFKRLLAQDAGAGGQILEESDLSDGAIDERLRSDLTARVLATRLLQRYGYLVARLNPGSDLEAEQKLARQNRAQMIARAERRDISSADSGVGSRPGCDSPNLRECALSPVAPEDHESLRVSPKRFGPAQNSSMLLQRAEETPQRPTASSDGTGDSPEQRSEDSPASPSPGATLMTARQDLNSSPNRSPRPAGNTNAENPLLPYNNHSNLQDQSPNGGGTLRTRRGSDWDLAGRESDQANHSEPDQGRMVHRPNPYADVPSLYDLYVQASGGNRPLERFGLAAFRKGAGNPDYMPMDLPVGPGYVVGPGDGLSIDLWGGVSQRLLRTVDREGRVALPETGPVLVSGKTLGEVQEMVQHSLRTQFRDVSADVSLLRLRSVRVYVVGEISAPGAYDVSSFSTPLNALFAAGGVTAQGSLRRLQHYRGKQLLEEVDAYDLLLHGMRGELQRIENGDSLLVPGLGPVVTVEGMVRRPALYELRDEKTLLDVLDLAGGILPAAALRHIEVERLVAHERRTMLSVEIGDASDVQVVRTQLSGFTIRDGDQIHIFPIAPYNSESIYLLGHVLRPGRYSFKPEMRLTDLVGSYADLLPEPSNRYAEIIRLHAPDYRPVVETFDLASAFEHPDKSPKLEPLDTIHIFGRYDFEPEPEVFVSGEVRAPGSYRASGEEHLRDAIYQAGGAAPDAWLDSAQLFRRQPDGSTRVLSINLGAALAGDPSNNVLVQPRDRILVHRQPEQVARRSVYVRGEVARPGRYPLAVNMRVSDLVGSAGGLLRSANPNGGDLTHYATSSSSGQSVAAGDLNLNLAAAIAGEKDQNPSLRDGDVLTVPQQSGWNDMSASISVRGEVRRPGVYGIRPGEHLSSLLQRAGGLLPSAYPRAAVFERTEVRQLQEKSRQDLIQRLEQESTVVKTSVTMSGAEEAALQQAALQQRQRALEGLRNAVPSGRLVIHLRPERTNFAGSPEDIELRAGDSLTIPKQPGAVLVMGQVYNANALVYEPHRNAAWYFSRAGGATSLADKSAIFIVRADGSVTGRHQGVWSGSTLSAAVGPGDTIVVPERPVVGSSTLKNVLAVAQIASSAALVAAVAIP